MERHSVTIAIAISCPEGVVLASDSMGHARRIATRLKKIQVIDEHNISVAASGSEFMTQAALNGARKHPRSADVTPMAIAGVIEGILRDARERPLPPADPDDASPHCAEFLITAWIADGPSLIHIPDDLAAIECIDKPFVAVGSAHDFAHVVYETLAHHFESPLTLTQAKMLAYRIINTVCLVSSWGVGPPVQMSVVTKDGAALVGSAALEGLSAEVARWLAVESSYLTSMTADEADVTTKPITATEVVNPPALGTG
jgi:20S proteasome alpha/beta subunit